jgi:hypothetical protein
VISAFTLSLAVGADMLEAAQLLILLQELLLVKLGQLQSQKKSY